MESENFKGSQKFSIATAHDKYHNNYLTGPVAAAVYRLCSSSL